MELLGVDDLMKVSARPCGDQPGNSSLLVLLAFFSLGACGVSATMICTATIVCWAVVPDFSTSRLLLPAISLILLACWYAATCIGISDLAAGLRGRSALWAPYMQVSAETMRTVVSRGRDDVEVRQKNITVLFVAIRDFEAIVGWLKPDQVAHALEIYHSMMIPIIQSFDGMIAQKTGSGILAYWNLASHVEAHVCKACNAAVLMPEVMEHLNASLVSLALPTLQTIAGIHNGEVLSGTIGEVKLQFGFVQDAVNAAQHLSHVCELHGCSAICSEAIVQQLPTELGTYARLLGQTRVKGMTEDVTIYELGCSFEQRLFDLLGMEEPKSLKARMAAASSSLVQMPTPCVPLPHLETEMVAGQLQVSCEFLEGCQMAINALQHGFFAEGHAIAEDLLHVRPQRLKPCCRASRAKVSVH